ncbi:uncharacterized protein J4E84_011036 [Alternaria hordeiaustralica]|uniref:uncharacterized protein n=1 Tax=Alternaria hordeiaustralica TaxID=1187925 RepID=UPI0020C38578|nr:uncharacterized protein J4E84_011036 [Alternaria hordeiaustralica]KAI4673510.1 hypothetical protein J4E84_011036 [Alternaria hordeiaustralica]
MGEQCPFSHEIRENLGMPKTLSDHTPIKDVGLTAPSSARADPSSKEHDETEIPRTIGGATVEFANGASVSKISLISDFSAVFTSDLSPHTSVQDLVDFLINRGFPQVTHDCVPFRHIPEKLHKTAVIKVRDPGFANKLLQCLQNTPVRLGDFEFRASKMQVAGETASGMNRLQLTSVTCSWFNPSKVAYLEYDADWKAKRALERMERPNSNEFQGRKLDVTYQPLEQKMQVTPLVSIKLSVSSRILAAIGPQLDPLVDQIWRTDYVQIKSYKTLGKQYTQVRIFGQSREPVAKAKSAVEKLLAGQIATDGHGPITDPFYFRPSSKNFLNDLGASHGVFIHQDSRRSVLRLYGDHMGIERVESALVAKCAELREQSHTVILHPEALAFALKGGFRNVVAALGKDKVKLDIINTPKRIIVEGSAEDAVQVQKILASCTSSSLETQTAGLSNSEDDGELLCPVCFTPPEDPIKTFCSHAYCNSCLVSQCTFADSFPVKCLGEDAVCDAPLYLSDVKKVLSGTEYDDLLQTSLTSYLRSRPTEFHYCSTPDCDRFYRISSAENPRIFDCDGCLTSICTSCHQGPHDGHTCETNKALMRAAMEEDEKLTKWKKDHDVRDCPKCGVPIEKADGCNHMTCTSCQAHICWFCMKTLSSGGETYNHMQSVHSGV